MAKASDNSKSSKIKRFIFRSLSLENYLRLLQRSYFLLYKSGALRLSENYSYHYFVRKFIKEGDVVIDIGANLGYYSVLFARWTGEKGAVYSVEPIRIYNKIFNEKAAKYKQIILYPYALGLEEKRIEMVSSPHIGYLRTGLPHVYDPDRDGSIDEQEFKFEAKMKQASLLFKDLERIDYIKCDIEGFENVVLSDMKALINKHRPKVQVEVWKENEDEILQIFNELGYNPFKIYNKQLVLIDDHNKDLPGDYIFIPS